MIPPEQEVGYSYISALRYPHRIFPMITDFKKYIGKRSWIKLVFGGYMKLIQILKVAAISVVSGFTFVSTSNTALADYLNSQGSGGNYRYELWSTDDNSSYYLKIWLYEASPTSSPRTTTRGFDSTREALIYFDCNYAERSLPECPR